MANTSAVYARIDSGLKENAESILQQLGISPSSAIQMLYSQIVLTRGLPLYLHLPSRKPTMIGDMSREELDAELMKGTESLKSGKTYTADEVDAELAKNYMVDYDESGSIGKRYRRQDEIGTPFCITVDFETETDGCVTVRDRDTMEQERIPVSELNEYIAKRVSF